MGIYQPILGIICSYTNNYGVKFREISFFSRESHHGEGGGGVGDGGE
jgi:hypothetical protein